MCFFSPISATVATVPFDTKAYDERNSSIISISKDFHEIAKTIDYVQAKLKESELKSPERSLKNSPSTKSKKRSLKSKLYNERLKRLKQDKSKSQYEDTEDSEELPKNGKIVVESSCNVQEEETEMSKIGKIQRDLELLNQQIREDLEARKRRCD